MKADSARTIFYALGANLAIAAAKTAAAVATGSSGCSSSPTSPTDGKIVHDLFPGENAWNPPPKD